MSFISSIVGGIMGAHAAGQAANAEEQGAQQAQKTIEKNQNAANQFQTGVWTGTQAAEQPYQTLGSTSAGDLNALLQKGFTAPTLAEAENTPGYQFNLQQGTQAIDENAAANGTLMSGNTGVALEKFGQGLAQNTYQQAYQNALNSYMTNYQTLLGGTQTGLTSTGQLGQFGQEAANTTANIDLTSAEQIAKQQNNAAAARASGYLGEAAGYSNAIGGALNAGASIFTGGMSSLIPGGQ